MNNKELIVNAQMSHVYTELRKYYNSKSILQIIGKERDENTHSNIIAWLLDDSPEHGLGLTPIRLFLMLISICMDKDENAEAKKSYNNQPLLDLFLDKRLNITGINISREKTLGENGEVYTRGQRLDIVIELNISINDKNKILPIIIENKVLSYEHRNNYIEQTNAYKEWADKKYDSEEFLEPVLIYLTPKIDDKPNNKSFAVVTYQELVDKVIEPCFIYMTSEEAKYRIKDYLRCLSYTDFEKNYEKGDIVMAMTKNERELLIKFKDENKDLLFAILAAIKEDEEDETTTAIKEVTKSIIKRNTERYLYNGDVYAKNRLVYQVIKDYIDSGLATSLEDLKSKFETAGSRNAKKLIKTEDEYNMLSSDGKTRFWPVDFNHETIYISNQIGVSENKKDSTDIDNFLNQARKLGFVIEINK